jgi:hypothetical protein
MLREIYIRNEDDPKFVENKIEEGEMLEVLVQHLMMLFATCPGEVIAYPNYGLNLEDMLFEFELDKDTVLSEINYQYAQFISPYFPTVQVEFDLYISDGEISKIMILDVYIDSKLVFQITN